MIAPELSLRIDNLDASNPELWGKREELEKLYPGQKIIVPNGKAQGQFMFDWKTPLCSYVSGMGGGKTWAGARKLRDQHCFNAFDEKGNRTAIKSLAVAPTYGLAETIVFPSLTAALDEAGIVWEFIADKIVYAIYLPDLSRGKWNRRLNRYDDLSLIYLRSAYNAEKITGFECGIAWGDEAARWPTSVDPTNDPFVQIQGRLRGKARVRQQNYTSTHEGDITTFFEMFEKPHAGRTIYRGTTWDNKANVSESYIKDMLMQFSKATADQYISGVARTLRGTLLYHAFNEAVQCHSVPELRSDRPLHLAVDFNHTPGMHGVIGQRADNGNPDSYPSMMFADTEIEYDDGSLPRTIPAMVQQFEKWVNKTGGWRWPELWVFGDATKATTAQRGETTHQVLLQELRARGYPINWKIARSNPFIADRVNATNAMLEDAMGQCRFKINARCTRTIADCKSLRWTSDAMKIDKGGNILLSHATDAIGYWLWYMTGFIRDDNEHGAVARPANVAPLQRPPDAMPIVRADGKTIVKGLTRRR